MESKEILSQNEAAAFIGLTPRFLEARRIRGGGPDYVRISKRCIKYRRCDLDRWLSERIKTSTSYPPGKNQKENSTEK